MNSVHLIGNLTRDPELRYSTGANQTAICRFTIAVNDGYGERQRTSFIPIVVFNKQAENCDRYLAKGRKVAVVGRIQTGSYTNKDGNTVYTTDVIANNVEFLSSANQGGGSGFGGQQGGFGQSAPQGGFGGQQGSFGQAAQDFGQAPQSFEQSPATPDDGIPEGFQALQDDDIPF